MNALDGAVAWLCVGVVFTVLHVTIKAQRARIGLARLWSLLPVSGETSRAVVVGGLFVSVLIWPLEIARIVYLFAKAQLRRVR